MIDAATKTKIVDAALEMLAEQESTGYGLMFNGRYKDGAEPTVNAQIVCERLGRTGGPWYRQTVSRDVLDLVNTVLKADFRTVHVTRAAGNVYYFGV